MMVGNASSRYRQQKSRVELAELSHDAGVERTLIFRYQNSGKWEAQKPKQLSAQDERVAWWGNTFYHTIT